MGRSGAKVGGYLPWMVLGKSPSCWASIGMVTMAVLMVPPWVNRATPAIYGLQRRQTRWMPSLDGPGEVLVGLGVHLHGDHGGPHGAPIG
jgi:hypothetical protein